MSAKPPFNVEYHHSPRCRFAHDTPDDAWLAEVGRRGWIVMSHDRKFHLDPAAMSAIKQHSIGCFYLWGAEATAWDKLTFVVHHAEKFVSLARATPKPFIYHFAKSGRISRISLSA
ncbi:MAG: hypothetical protein FJX11_10635 [Alphaproteobacteria bacterium]|nr:hypothetical protein [Alphaproteobacteria bacterium]